MSGSRGWRFGNEIPGLLRAEQSLPVDEQLVVVERADAYLVTVAGSDGDWIARFERTEGIDAAGWAENMALIYNRRFAACRQQASEISTAAGQDAHDGVGGGFDADGVSAENSDSPV